MRATASTDSNSGGTPLEDLRDSWLLHLEARNLSPKTIIIYRDAANALLRYLAERNLTLTSPRLRREHVDGLLAAMRGRDLSRDRSTTPASVRPSNRSHVSARYRFRSVAGCDSGPRAMSIHLRKPT